MTTQFESELAEAQARSFFKQGDFANADKFSVKALKANPNNRGARLVATKLVASYPVRYKMNLLKTYSSQVIKTSLYGLHTLSKRLDLIQTIQNWRIEPISN